MSAIEGRADNGSTTRVKTMEDMSSTLRTVLRTERYRRNSQMLHTIRKIVRDAVTTIIDRSLIMAMVSI